MASKLTVSKRNIIVIGVTGCGKSTVCNKIIGEESFNVAEGFMTGTTEIKSETRQVDYEDTKLDITVIDTIGLSDAHRSNSDTVHEIQKKIKEIGGLNLVLFVMKYNRLTTAETTVLKIIEENLKHAIGRFSAVIITGCEHMDDEARKIAIKKLKEDDITRKFTANMGKDIHTVGFPDTTKMPPTLKPLLAEIGKCDRQKLLKLIHQADRMYSYDAVFGSGCLDNLMITWKAIKALFTKKSK